MRKDVGEHNTQHAQLFLQKYLETKQELDETKEELKATKQQMLVCIHELQATKNKLRE